MSEIGWKLLGFPNAEGWLPQNQLGTLPKSQNAQGSIPRNSDFRLGKAQESVCLQKLCHWFWRQVWNLDTQDCPLFGRSTGTWTHMLWFLDQNTFFHVWGNAFHSQTLITPTRALKEVLLMPNPTCEWKEIIKPTRQKICPDTLMNHYGYNITILS